MEYNIYKYLLIDSNPNDSLWKYNFTSKKYAIPKTVEIKISAFIIVSNYRHIQF